MREIPALLLEVIGETCTKHTVYHWAKYGRINFEGDRIYLKTTKRLGKKYTTKEWVFEFVEAIA